jgi:hypothetical protein
VFLSNLIAGHDQTITLDRLVTKGISSDRLVTDQLLGVESSDLLPQEIEQYRPTVFRLLAQRNSEDLYLKTHEAYTKTADGEAVFPSDVTRAAVYVVRNPLDVCVSFACHTGKSIDEIIDIMARDTIMAEYGHKLSLQLPQRLLSWDSHVTSWIDQNSIRTHLVRYEDMCARPHEAFDTILQFLGIEAGIERIRNAVSNSSFEVLQRQEEEFGFREKPIESKKFFRTGRPGGWREALTRQQYERICVRHWGVMNQLGYDDPTP